MVQSILNADEVENKTVPRQVFLKVKQELEDKCRAISALSEKICHLENIIKFKDERIAALMSQITKHQNINTPRAFSHDGRARSSTSKK